MLEYLLKRGSTHCLAAANELVVPLAALAANFMYIGPDGRDYGVNVRLRCGRKGGGTRARVCVEVAQHMVGGVQVRYRATGGTTAST